MTRVVVSIALGLALYLFGYNRGHDQGYGQAQRDASEEIAQARRVARAFQSVQEQLVPNNVLYTEPTDYDTPFRTPPLEDR